MTPRERWLALLEGKTPDRIPTDYQATDEVTARLRRDLGCADDEALYRKLHIDARRFVEPVWRRPPDLDPRADLWGIVYRSISYGTGSYLEPEVHPLATAQSAADVHAHRWPSCDDFDYAPSRGRSSRTTVSGRSTPADTSRSCCTAICAACKRRWRTWPCGRRWPKPPWATSSTSTTSIIAASSRPAAGGSTLTWVAEDLGSQTGPLMSLAMYRRFLLPNQIKMADLARRYGVHVMYHTDGAARVFLPDLIDRVGIEILNPIQWRCPGMEREKLVADFGRRIIFHGSIDNQQTLPFGSVDDVVREVRESVAIYRGARWICGPCHNLQPVSPTANIVAMYEAIHELGAGE